MTIRLTLVALILAAIAAGGCTKGEVSASDSEAVKEKFSKDAYEDAMIKSGKQAELEEHKRKEEEYLRQQGGGDQQGQ